MRKRGEALSIITSEGYALRFKFICVAKATQAMPKYPPIRK